ncbi:MAG: hypothetical protein M1831_002845 [Alyxoria varia]|nr:MAG: hypothetical protein M1831_002845 [Alyxoria varia]
MAISKVMTTQPAISQAAMSQPTGTQGTITHAASVGPMAWIHIFHGTLYQFEEEGRELVLSKFRASPEVGNSTCSYNVDEDIFEIGCLARDGDTASSTLAGIISDFIDTEGTNDDQFEDYEPKVKKFPDSLAQDDLLDPADDASAADDSSAEQDDDDDDDIEEFWSPDADSLNLTAIFTRECLLQLESATGTSLTLDLDNKRVVVKAKADNAADEAVDRLENLAEYWEDECPVEHVLLKPPLGFIVRFEKLRSMFDGTLGRLLVTPESPLHGKGPLEMRGALHICRSLRSGRESERHGLEQRTVKPLPAPAVDPVAQAFGAVEYLEIGTHEPREVPASRPASPTNPSMKGVENWIHNVGNGPASKVREVDGSTRITNTSDHWKNATAEPWGDINDMPWNQPSFPDADDGQKFSTITGQNGNDIRQDPGSIRTNDESLTQSGWKLDPETESQAWKQEADTMSQDWNGITDANETRSVDSIYRAPSVMSRPDSVSQKRRGNADADETGSVGSIYRAPSVVSRPESTRSFHTAQTQNAVPAARGTSSSHHAVSPESNLSRSMRPHPSVNGGRACRETISPQKQQSRKAGKVNGRPLNVSAPKFSQHRTQKELGRNSNTNAHKTQQATGKLIDLESMDGSHVSEFNWTTVGNKSNTSREPKPVANSEDRRKPNNRFHELADLDFFSSPEASSSSQPSSGDARAPRPPEEFLNGTKPMPTFKSPAPIENESNIDEIEEDESDDRVFFRVARQRAPAPGSSNKKGKKKANQTNDKVKQQVSPRSRALGGLKQSYQFDLPTRTAPDKENKREDNEELMSTQKALSLGTKKHLPCKLYRVKGDCPFRPTCPYSHTKAPLPPCQKFLMGQCKFGDNCHFPHSHKNQRGTDLTAHSMVPTENGTIAERMFNGTMPTPQNEVVQQKSTPANAEKHRKKKKKNMKVPKNRTTRKQRRVMRKQAPDDKFLAGVKAALERARMFRGAVSTELQLGQIVVSRPVDELTQSSGIKEENFTNYMSHVKGFAKLSETFTNLITTETTDLSLVLKTANVNPNHPPLRVESFVELACECANQTICRIIVPLCKDGGEPYVTTEDELIGAVYMHAPRYVWDARFLVTGNNVYSLNAIAGAAPLMKNLFIRTSNEQKLPMVQGRDNEHLRLQSVRLFTKLCYSPTNTSAYDVHIKRIHDYSVIRHNNVGAAQNRGLFRAESLPETVMVDDWRLWYEVSLKPALKFSHASQDATVKSGEETLIDLEPEAKPDPQELFKENPGLKLGQKASWQVDDVVDGEAIRRVRDVARRMCEELNDVGAGNKGPAWRLEKEKKEHFERKNTIPDEFW